MLLLRKAEGSNPCVSPHPGFRIRLPATPAAPSLAEGHGFEPSALGLATASNGGGRHSPRPSRINIDWRMMTSRRSPRASSHGAQLSTSCPQNYHRLPTPAGSFRSMSRTVRHRPGWFQHSSPGHDWQRTVDYPCKGVCCSQKTRRRRLGEGMKWSDRRRAAFGVAE